ncbi:MAG TPA: type II toxin-antitoxin system VapC family toxin [Candidatus Limnocylindrales bacterium]|nr:type II toxin-antitoxin system VapC family toxin [Candidatus Limnocylindrales bacterium]
MIVVDVNLLIYAVNQDSPDHDKAKKWLEAAVSGTETVGLPWIVLLAFLRLTTRSGIFQKPLSVDAAFDVVDAWLQQGSVTVPEPTARHLQTMRDLIAPLGTGGNLTTDAHLAALAIEHGAELCSTDNDFGRFSRLRWRNPLAR